MPCVLRPGLVITGDTAADGDPAARAGDVWVMLAENLHCQGLSAVEDARGAPGDARPRVPLARVATSSGSPSSGLARKTVAKATGSPARP